MSMKKKLFSFNAIKKTPFMPPNLPFANQEGNCGSYKKRTCGSSNNTVDILTQECIGKVKCSIDVSTEKFRAPDCSGTARRLAVEVICNSRFYGIFYIFVFKDLSIFNLYWWWFHSKKNILLYTFYTFSFSPKRVVVISSPPSSLSLEN